MKKNRLGITEGEVKVVSGIGSKFDILVSHKYVCHVMPIKYHKEQESNATLISDAFNTANKCGLLPSELLEQRDELLTCLKNTYGKLTAQTPEYIFDAIQDTINQIEQQTKTNE